MKNKRNINALNLILLMILSLTFISTAQAQYHFRIGSPEGSYIGLFVTKDDKIDKEDKFVAKGGTLSIDRKDKFVATGGTLSISTNEAMLCERNTCVFKIGFIISRKLTQGTKVAIDVQLYAKQGDAYVKQNDEGPGGMVKAMISFPELSKTQSKILPLKLKVGKNTVTLDINQQTSIPDGDSNYSVKVTINVI